MYLLKRWLRDSRGNFGLLTALLLLPVTGCAGLALDLTDAYQVRLQLMDAADAAALGAISETSPAMAKIQQMTGDGEVQVGEQDGKSFFLAQRNFGLKTLPMDVSVKITKAGGNISSAVFFSAQVPTTFMKIFGDDSVPVSGTATAVYKSESYSDFYMLLDNSPSMGIGATQQDINALMAATANSPDAAGRNCTFACHMGYLDNKGKLQGENDSDYLIARANNVTLRIDVVTKAVNTLLNTVRTSQSSPDQFRVAAYTFGTMASESGYSIERVVGLTEDLTTAGNAAKQIELMITAHHNFNEDALTSFDTALTDIGNEIKTDGGSGSSTGNRQEVVFFVTDGLGDSKKTTCQGSWASSDRCLEPIDLQVCSALKNRNIKIAILYTTYLPLPSDAIWNHNIGPVFSKDIGPKLKQCASDNLFFEVSPTDSMEDAMKALFIKAANTNLRLAS